MIFTIKMEKSKRKPSKGVAKKTDPLVRACITGREEEAAGWLTDCVTLPAVFSLNICTITERRGINTALERKRCTTRAHKHWILLLALDKYFCKEQCCKLSYFQLKHPVCSRLGVPSAMYQIRTAVLSSG